MSALFFLFEDINIVCLSGGLSCIAEVLVEPIHVFEQNGQFTACVFVTVQRKIDVKPLSFGPNRQLANDSNIHISKDSSPWPICPCELSSKTGYFHTHVHKRKQEGISKLELSYQCYILV